MDFEQSLIYAGGQIMNAANVLSASKTTKQDRAFTREMYQRQREDNLADWSMMNAYNHPSAQMDRLVSSGLNPHLVYGSGAVANASSLPSHTPAQSVHGNVPRGVSMLQDYLALRRFDRENALINEQVESAKLDNAYKQQTLNSRVSYSGLQAEQLLYLTEISKNNRELKEWERDLQAEFMTVRNMIIHGHDQGIKFATQNEVGLEDVYADNLYRSLGENVLAIMNRQNWSAEEMLARIDMLNEQLKIMPYRLRQESAQAVIKEFHASLAEMGINPTDPLWMRIISAFIGGKDGIMSKISKLGELLDSVNYE